MSSSEPEAGFAVNVLSSDLNFATFANFCLNFLRLFDSFVWSKKRWRYEPDELLSAGTFP